MIEISLFYDEFVWPPYVWRCENKRDLCARYYGWRWVWQLNWLWWTFEVKRRVR